MIIFLILSFTCISFSYEFVFFLKMLYIFNTNAIVNKYLQGINLSTSNFSILSKRDAFESGSFVIFLVFSWFHKRSHSKQMFGQS